MFLRHTVLKGAFNRHYIINNSSLDWHAKSENLFGSADSFVRGLDASESYWWDLLRAYADIDLRHTHKSPAALVADLLERGRIKAYSVPSPEQLSKLASCSLTEKNTGVRHVFLPGNACLVVRVDHRRSFTSLSEAEGFLASAQLSDEQVNILAAFVNREIPLNLDARQRLAHALAAGALAVGVVSHSAPAKPTGSATQTIPVRPVSLGPHDQAGYVPPVAIPAAAGISAKPANPPAQSIAECEQRLAAARERLLDDNIGYQAKYTDQELLALADKGELDDRFVMRFTETKYAGDSAYLGRQDANGSVRFWSTTFNQLENADTDPETICAVLGLPDYDPTKDYALVVVDTHAVGAGQSVSIVPTYKRLGEFAIEEVEDLAPETVRQVMTPEYNPVYAEHMAQFKAEKRDIANDGHIQSYSNKAFTSDLEKQQFETRARIHKRLGANEFFRGDGTTENLLPNQQQCGVMETFTYDKSPQTLSSLESTNSAKRISTTPLGKSHEAIYSL